MNRDREKLSERVYFAMTPSQLRELDEVALSLIGGDEQGVSRERASLIRRFVTCGIEVYQRRLAAFPGVRPIVSREMLAEMIDREVAKELA